ncbi:MAG TPA: magnesium transporter CorA family protein [Candidatus Paceibacterota bacterium]|nr:magnesium transporter CorA family protein [Candidatus Paceibacterota bacterium]
MEIKKGKGVQWVDVEKPLDKDLAWLAKEYHLHPVIVDELRGPSSRGRVEAYKDYLFFIYYFPVYDPNDEASARTEIDFIITKDSIATIHYDPLDGVMEEINIAACDSSLAVMYHLIEHLINFQERQLRHIREKVESVGKEIFKDKEKDVLERITYLKRDVSEYRIVVRLQEPILRSLLAKGKKFWGDTAEIYLNDLMGDQLKIVNQLEDYREAISDFEDTNNQLMNLKINSVMKTFTSLSFLTFPFLLLAALFSMNTRDTPIVGLPDAFWIVLGVMVIGMVGLTAYFKRKGWF